MKKIIIAIAILLLTSCTITGQVSQDTVKIGIISPLTGNLDIFGERMEKGLEIAKDENTKMQD